MSRRKRPTYARARLYLGMANVGFWVGLAIVGLLAKLYEFFPNQAVVDRKNLTFFAGFLFGYVILQAPFDWLGGYLLPKYYKRYLSDFSDYITTWARGAVVQTAVLFLIGFSMLFLGQWLVFLAAGWVIVLLLLQYPLARGIADLRLRGKGRLKSADEAFTGGIVGLPGFQKIIFANSHDKLLQSINQKRRDFLQRAFLPESGIITAIAFHLVGILLINLLISHPINSVSGLVESAFWFTLWSFLGILILPSVSRPAVYAADYALFVDGVPLEDFKHYVTWSPSQNGEDSRHSWVETVFHPVPSTENRLSRWGKPPGWRGGWHAARYAIYLSWGGLSLLGRAVHCNIGKPDVWVLLPCD